MVRIQCRRIIQHLMYNNMYESSSLSSKHNISAKSQIISADNIAEKIRDNIDSAKALASSKNMMLCDNAGNISTLQLDSLVSAVAAELTELKQIQTDLQTQKADKDVLDATNIQVSTLQTEKADASKVVHYDDGFHLQGFKQRRQKEYLGNNQWGDDWVFVEKGPTYFYPEIGHQTGFYIKHMLPDSADDEFFSTHKWVIKKKANEDVA